jgi:hypothetical protein
MGQLILSLLTIVILLGGMEIVTRRVPILNRVYRWLIRFFFTKPAKAVWRRLEKRTRRRRKAVADWFWALPVRGIRWVWAKARPVLRRFFSRAGLELRIVARRFWAWITA